jgi:DNA relaxase NicK
VKRWYAKSSEQLLAELGDVQAYEIEFENKTYQVEVEVLENTEKYVHVMVAVDDASLSGALRPLSTSFIREK